MKTGYDCTAVRKFIDHYRNECWKVDKEPDIITLQEGTLGYGTMVLKCDGFKTVIIKEFYVNHWSSLHTIRCYNKTPKKYLILIERKENEYGND